MLFPPAKEEKVSRVSRKNKQILFIVNRNLMNTKIIEYLVYAKSAKMCTIIFYTQITHYYSGYYL